MLIEARNQFG